MHFLCPERLRGCAVRRQRRHGPTLIRRGWHCLRCLYLPSSNSLARGRAGATCPSRDPRLGVFHCALPRRGRRSRRSLYLPTRNGLLKGRAGAACPSRCPRLGTGLCAFSPPRAVDSIVPLTSLPAILRRRPVATTATSACSHKTARVTKCVEPASLIGRRIVRAALPPVPGLPCVAPVALRVAAGGGRLLRGSLRRRRSRLPGYLRGRQLRRPCRPACGRGHRPATCLRVAGGHRLSLPCVLPLPMRCLLRPIRWQPCPPWPGRRHRKRCRRGRRPRPACRRWRTIVTVVAVTEGASESRPSYADRRLQPLMRRPRRR